MMERRFAKFFHRLVQELIADNGQRDQLFDSLRRYQSSQKLHELLVDLRRLLDEPYKLELYEFIRPLILLRHQMEYSYLAPAVPGVRLRTVRLQKVPGHSLGFAVRGGYEFSVGVFVSMVEAGSQAEKQGLKVGDEIVRVNGFTIAEAIHDDVLSLIKSQDEIVLKVTHIGMLPVKNHASDSVTWQYVEDMDSKTALQEILAQKQVRRGRGMDLKIFIDCTGHESIGCGILSGPQYYPGIFVEKVRPASLAQEVGLEVGDQILEVNDNSFLNIGHKEAVVVLKGSKQLNVVIRKHAGLPLFERRNTPTRGGEVTASSNPTPDQPSSSSVTSQRSSLQTTDNDSRGLDEGTLIAQQLNRRNMFRQAASTWEESSSFSDGNQARISTQAMVHSDSDSFPGNNWEGPRVPVDKPVLVEHPTPPSPQSPPEVPPPPHPDCTYPGTDCTSLVLPDHLDESVHSSLSTPESPPLPSSTSLPLDPPSSLPLDPSSSLLLPSDLGDPVLMALHRSRYSADIPSWARPRIRTDEPNSESSLDPDLEKTVGDLDVVPDSGGPSDVPQPNLSVCTNNDTNTDNTLVGYEGSASGSVTNVSLAVGTVDEGEEGFAFSAVSKQDTLSGQSSKGKGTGTESEGRVLVFSGNFNLSKPTAETAQAIVETNREVFVAGENFNTSMQAGEKADISVKSNRDLLENENCSVMNYTDMEGDCHTDFDVNSKAADRQELATMTQTKADCCERKSKVPVFVAPPPPGSPPPDLETDPSVAFCLSLEQRETHYTIASTQTQNEEGQDGATVELQDAADTTRKAVIELRNTSTFDVEETEEESLGMVNNRYCDNHTANADINTTGKSLLTDSQADKLEVGDFSLQTSEPEIMTLSAYAGADHDRNNMEDEESLHQEEAVNLQVTVDVHVCPASVDPLGSGKDMGNKPGVDSVFSDTMQYSWPWSKDSLSDGKATEGEKSKVGLTFPETVDPAGDTEEQEQMISFEPQSNADSLRQDIKDSLCGNKVSPSRSALAGGTEDVANSSSDHGNIQPGMTSEPKIPSQSPSPPLPPPPQPRIVILSGAAAALAARQESGNQGRSPRLLRPAGSVDRSAAPLNARGSLSRHSQLAVWFSTLELDGRELKAFVFPKSQSLGLEMEGGTGTPLAGRIVVAAVFDGGAAVDQGLQTGDQLMMINGHKLVDITVAQAEDVLAQAYSSPEDMIQVVYTQSDFLNDEECVTYF